MLSSKRYDNDWYLLVQVLIFLVTSYKTLSLNVIDIVSCITILNIKVNKLQRLYLCWKVYINLNYLCYDNIIITTNEETVGLYIW